MQGVACLIFLSFSVVYLLNSDQGGLPQSSMTSSSSGVRSSSSSQHAASASSGMERLRLATISNGELLRRRLLQSSDGGYIGYGALSGDSVPCPPQSGRSYYTPNCQSATGPVNPYTRGCSTITRCARD